MLTLRFRSTWNLRLPMLAAILTAASPLALPTAARAATPMPQEDEGERVYQGEEPYRYASVRALDGDVRIRKGDVDEALSRGTPVGEGDVVDSRGRGVLQLGDGTRVAFGRNTHFTVAALFADQNGGRQVLLRLDRGTLRVNYGAESAGRIRIDTPSGTASLESRARATVEVDSDRSVRLLVASGRLTFTNDRDQARLVAGERLTVYSGQDRLDRVRSYNTYDQDEFDEWSDGYLTARRSASWDYVPSEVRYYSDDLDDNGSWVDVPEVGWCWRPRAAYGDWRPYGHGRWGAYAGGLTWVSDEPWGYLTYHYGRWGWGADFGWYWIPGVYYSPAWVAWNWSGGYCGWAPLGYYNYPCTWGYGGWNGYFAWNVVNINYINVTNIHSRLVSDHNVIVNLSGGTGATTWTTGGRSLRPPWRTSPVIATHAEFRNPSQLGTAFTRNVAEQRLTTYQRTALATTGRTVNVTTARATGRTSPAPFENRQNTTGLGRGVLATERGGARFENRPAGGTPTRTPGTTPMGERPVDRPRDLTNGRTGRDSRPVDRPADHPVDRPADRPRDRVREDRPVETPRERFQDRPRDTFRDERPAPPRDRPRDEYRPMERPREESRPMERPREESRPAPRPEPRPSPPPRQESRPAPSHESAPHPESRPSSPPADRGGHSESRRGR